MKREDGFTLIELLVAASLLIVVLGATLTAVERFHLNTNRNQAQNDAQESARAAVDRMAKELRNAAAPAAGSNVGIGRALGGDLVFQSVDDTGASGGSNYKRAQWVRYCLDSSVPTDGKIWRQTYTWTGATAPAVPFATVCPDTSVGTSNQLTDKVVNASGSPAAAMFKYDPPLPASPSATNYSQIQHIAIDVRVNSDPKRTAKSSDLRSGIYLRNQAVPPTARFDQPSVSASGVVYLNGSPSTDALGNSLTYLWCDTTGGTTCTTATAIGQGVTMEYDSPSGTRTITLIVTNKSGQTDSTSQQVTVP